MNKGIVFREYGSIDKLELADLPEPQSVPEAHAIVRVSAIGLNPRDLSIIEGKFKFLSGRNFPKLVSADFAGEIVGLPPETTGFKVGDRVFGYYEGLRGGVSAQFCAIPLAYLAHQPPGLDSKIASAIGCASLTAYKVLVERASVKRGDKVLIYGASGGVGTAAIQIAKKLGAEVTAVSHSRNEAYCLDQGAAHFVAYDTGDPFNTSDSYNLFFQVYSGGGSLYGRGKKLVKKSGHYFSLIPNPLTRLLGRFRRPQADYVLVKSNTHHLAQIAGWLQRGEIGLPVDQVYELEHFDRAYRDLKAGKINGKAVITMPG